MARASPSRAHAITSCCVISHALRDCNPGIGTRLLMATNSLLCHRIKRHSHEIQNMIRAGIIPSET